MTEIQEEVAATENFFLKLWEALTLSEIETPEEVNRLLSVYVRAFHRVAEMEIETGAVWFKKSQEIKAVTENKSQFDFEKKTCEEYYLYSLVSKNADKLSDFKTSLQSKLRNANNELNS